MKKIMPYVALTAFEAVWGLFCGLTDVHPRLCFCAAFLIPLVTLTLLRRRDKNGKGFGQVILLSILLAAVPFAVSTEVNRADGKFVSEYDVTVESVNYRGSGSIKFKTPDGRDGEADLGENRLIIRDGEDLIEAGDTVTVREYVGVLGKTYYVLAGETKK